MPLYTCTFVRQNPKFSLQMFLTLSNPGEEIVKRLINLLHKKDDSGQERTDESISPAVTPSSQMSRSLKSISVPSSPATDVSFELPSEDIVQA